MIIELHKNPLQMMIKPELRAEDFQIFNILEQLRSFGVMYEAQPRDFNQYIHFLEVNLKAAWNDEKYFIAGYRQAIKECLEFIHTAKKTKGLGYKWLSTKLMDQFNTIGVRIISYSGYFQDGQQSFHT